MTTPADSTVSDEIQHSRQLHFMDAAALNLGCLEILTSAILVLNGRFTNVAFASMEGLSMKLPMTGFSKIVSAIAVSLLFSIGTASATVVNWDNSPGSGSISSFGNPDSQTYGQVFTAPITGKMTSFTLWLNGGVGSLFGGVGDWNGTAGFGIGFGSPNNLYQSANVTSTSGGPYTFAPNIDVTAGQRYVAYLSVFGVEGAQGATSMPLSSTLISGVEYFVWNNFNTGINGGNSDPRNNPSWNYFLLSQANGPAQFAATFEAVPEPGSVAVIAMAMLSLAAFGVMRRRSNA